MKIKCLLFFVAAVFIIPLNAQETTDTAVSVPSVSRLQGEVRNNLVRLSWTDSPDVRGPVYIYRSTYPFEGMGPFQGTRRIEVPYGVQFYIDEIENGGTLYYFAAASDETGRSYDIPINSANTISIQIPLSSFVPVISKPIAVPEKKIIVANIQPGLSPMEAAVQGYRVILTFSQEDTKNATLYRSTRPIQETQDLLGAVIIQTNAGSPFTDLPVPGISYYYAVIAEEDLIRGTVKIVPGYNATRYAVEVSPDGKGSQNRVMRVMPLPQISVKAAVPGINAYNEIPAPRELSPEAAKALGNIPVRSQSGTVLKKPRVFTRNLNTSMAEVEEYALSSVVSGPFAARNWDAAREEFVRFLTLPRNPEIVGRARFYLGQCYYFLNRPEDGLFEFLAVRDRYPAEAMEWIQASLDMMKDKRLNAEF